MGSGAVVRLVGEGHGLSWLLLGEDHDELSLLLLGEVHGSSSPPYVMTLIGVAVCEVSSSICKKNKERDLV